MSLCSERCNASTGSPWLSGPKWFDRLFSTYHRQLADSPGGTAIPLPIKLYVALRVGVVVILSQSPTPGTIEYSKNRFCGETYVLAGVLKSQVFKLCFGAKSFVIGKKLAKLRKEDQ